jgi:ankyrin repeat protein
MVIEPLLKMSPDVNLQTKDGWTPLHLVCRYGTTEMVESLLKMNPYVNLQTKDGCTPLYIACKYGNVEMVESLLKMSPDVNLQTKDGCTPLHAACEKGHLESVKLLLGNNAIRIDIGNKFGQTPLYMASDESGHHEVISELLRAGAAIDRACIDGCTPLVVACTRGNSLCVDVLLKAGASTQKKNNYRRSPLANATFNCHVESVRLLLAAGAEVEKNLVNHSHVSKPVNDLLLSALKKRKFHEVEEDDVEDEEDVIEDEDDEEDVSFVKEVTWEERDAQLRKNAVSLI